LATRPGWGSSIFGLVVLSLLIREL
jgi:hypothetical protein